MQLAQHRHDDLIFLLGRNNEPMGTIDGLEQRRAALGRRVRALREQKGFTQPQLADLAGWECKPGWEEKLRECESAGCFIEAAPR